MKLKRDNRLLCVATHATIRMLSAAKNSLFKQLLTRKLTLLAIIVPLLYSISTPSTLFALESDRNEPVHIRADNVKINENTGISIYTGDVKITQGSMSLLGSKVTVYQNNGELKKIIVVGQPAQFTQLADKTMQTITATALQLEYVTADEELILTDSAILKQGQNRFSGQTITYNTRNSTVTASTNDQSQQRVNAIIIPKPQENQ